MQQNNSLLYCATRDNIWIQLQKGLFALLALRELAGPVVPAVSALETVATSAVIVAHLAVHDLQSDG